MAVFAAVRGAAAVVVAPCRHCGGASGCTAAAVVWSGARRGASASACGLERPAAGGAAGTRDVADCGGGQKWLLRILQREADEQGGGRILFETSIASASSSCSSSAVRRLRALRAETVVISSPAKPWEAGLGARAGGRGATACVSSQAGGCPLDCSFCDTGLLPGPVANLPAWAIVAQVRAARRLNSAVRRVTFMGMGEPLLNYAEVSAAIAELHQDEDFRRPWAITVSTVGVVPRIARLAVDHPNVALTVSLHAANPALRARLLPASAARWPVEDVVQAAWEHQAATGRAPMFAYTVLPGVNDSESDADDVARLLTGCKDGSAQRPFVNLVPYNRTKAGEAHGFQAPTRQQMQAFRTALRARGVRATVRWSTAEGRPLTAACGQLVARVQPRGSSAPQNLVAGEDVALKGGSVSETEESRETCEDPLAKLTRQLHRAGSVEETLSLVEASAAAMNGIHVSAAFVTLARAAPGAGVKLHVDPRFRGLLSIMEGLLPSLAAQASANILWALGKLKYRPKGALSAALSEASRREMHKFWPQNISNCLWACATLRLGSDAELVQALADEAACKASALTPVELTTAFWSLSVLRHWPGNRALRLLAREASTQKARFFGPRDMVTLLRACVSLGVPGASSRRCSARLRGTLRGAAHVILLPRGALPCGSAASAAAAAAAA